MSSPGVLAVIPARYASTRFPGKPLAEICGLPMILHVYRGVAALEGVDRVVVATDDERIKSVVEGDGGNAVMTARTHVSGTSRVREVASRHRYAIVLNVQGDEPLLPGRGVEKLIETMRSDPGISMGTLAARSKDMGDYMNSDVVKVVCDLNGNALYFSRSPLPFGPGERCGGGARTDRPSGTLKRNRAGSVAFLRHIGIYGFRRGFLLGYPAMKCGPLEKLESLEQLRALENGHRIRVIKCSAAPAGVDRPRDIKRVEKIIRSR